MSKLRWGIAAALAVGLFAFGALGPLRSGDLIAEPRIVAGDIAAPLIGGKDLDRAIQMLQRRVRAEPDDARSLALLGLAYVNRARISFDPSYYPKAASVLRRALEIEARSFEATLGMGTLALARHDFAEGLRWGRVAKRINPYSAEAHAVIGDALVELGRYRAAVRALQEMVDLRPALASFARVSYARELLGDGSGAVAAMRRALQSAGAPPDASWASHQLGELHFNAGRLVAARRAYRRGLFLDPESVPVRAGLARVAAARHRYGRAIDLLRKMTARVPAAEYVILLGEIYEAAGRPSAAARQYGLLDGIEGLLESGGVNVDLEQALFYADHGRARAALGAALAEWRRRKSVHVADALAWALYANERYGAARRFAAKALRLGTRSALFRYHAGMISLRAGRAAEARRHLATALDINPYFSVRHAPVARRALASIGEVRR